MKIIGSSIVTKATILNPLKRYNNKLCISTKYTNLIVDKSDISYLKADSNYCMIYCIDGSNLVCSKTLKEINNRIDNPKFIRVHKSYVVNIDEIRSIDANYNEIVLVTGTRIPISRARKTDVKEAIKLMFD